MVAPWEGRAAQEHHEPMLMARMNFIACRVIAFPEDILNDLDKGRVRWVPRELVFSYGSHRALSGCIFEKQSGGVVGQWRDLSGRVSREAIA